VHVVTLALLLLFATGCPNPAQTGTPTPTPETPATHIRGTAFDAVSGEPVAGVSVSLGADSALTAADGSFDIDLGLESGTRAGTWAVHAAGYRFLLVEQVQVSSGTTYRLALPMVRTDPSTYSSTIRIFGAARSPAGAEVPAGSRIEVTLLGSDGTSWRGSAVYASGYALDPPLRSPDCLLVALVTPVDAQHPFIVMSQGIDLSGSGPVEQDLAGGTAGFTDLAVTADRGGNTGQCVFLTAYGLVPGYFRTGTGSSNEVTPVRTFGSSNPEVVALFNPFQWEEAIWVQSEEAGGMPEGYRRSLMSTTQALVSQVQISLSAIDHTLGPGGGADPESLAFGSGLLSLTEVPGAGMYGFELRDIPSGRALGSLWSRGSEVELPDWLVRALPGVVECSLRVVDAGSVILDPALAGGWGPDGWLSLPEIRLGVVVGTGTLAQGLLRFTGTIDVRMQ
jgi:hypothetical protein